MRLNDWRDKILIVGDGGHANVLREIVHSINPKTTVYLHGKNNNTDLSILFYDHEYHYALNGIGGATKHLLRRKIFREMKNYVFTLPILMDLGAQVSGSAKFGAGCQIMAGAIVSTNVRCGENCLINTGAIVSHDCVLGNNVHVGPGAVLAGGVTVGDDCVIGMNATVFLGLEIPENTIIRNGENVE